MAVLSTVVDKFKKNKTKKKTKSKFGCDNCMSYSSPYPTPSTPPPPTYRLQHV